MIDIKEQDLKDLAEKKIESLTRDIKKWRAVIDALDNTNNQGFLFPKEEKKSAKQLRIKDKPNTLREKCEKILFDFDEPLTSRDLKKEVESRYKQKYEFNSFSGSFSQSYRRRNSMIKKYDVPDPSLKVKSAYCLKNWFDDTGILKEEYQKKIKQKYFV